jgi:hypothetical protein
MAVQFGLILNLLLWNGDDSFREIGQPLHRRLTGDGHFHLRCLMEAANSTTDNETQWPAVDAAYAFVVPSYQMLTGRFEAADNRIVSLLTMASSLTLAAPILARAVRPTISFSSWLFIGALAVFGVTVLGGLIARMRGALILPDPAVIRERSLAKSDWQFKADAICFAGRHFDVNARAINTKGNWSIGLTCLVVLEIALLVSWISR